MSEASACCPSLPNRNPSEKRNTSLVDLKAASVVYKRGIACQQSLDVLEKVNFNCFDPKWAHHSKSNWKLPFLLLFKRYENVF